MFQLLAFYFMRLALRSESVLIFLHASSLTFILHVYVLHYNSVLYPIFTWLHRLYSLISFSIVSSMRCFLLALPLFKEILAHFLIQTPLLLLWSYTSITRYVFMVWCLVKHRSNFYLYYYYY